MFDLQEELKKTARQTGRLFNARQKKMLLFMWAKRLV